MTDYRPEPPMSGAQQLPPSTVADRLARLAQQNGMQTGYVPPPPSDVPLFPAQPMVAPSGWDSPALAAPVALQPPVPPAPLSAPQSGGQDPYGAAAPYATDPYTAAPHYAPAPVSYAPHPYAAAVPLPYVPSVPAPALSPMASDVGRASHAMEGNHLATPYGVPTVTAQIMHQHPTLATDVQAPATQPHGYSDRAIGRALINDDTPKPSWRISDDAPRYQPPGTVEQDQDPFGLGALPQHVVYNGPKDLPNDTTLGFLLGLLSFVFFPFAFFGLRCTRRGRKMIAAAPNRYRGKMFSVLALVLCIVGPICSLAVGAHYLGYLPKF